MSTPTTQVTWFVARNHLGQFSCGQTASGDTYWTNDIAHARLYQEIGPVKAAVTKSVKRHPDDPIPEILEWTLDIATARVIDVAGETQKRVDRAARTKLVRQEAERKERLASLLTQEKRLAAERALLEASQS